MSNFPSQLDDDITLPPVNNNIDDVGAEVINATRDALFAIEGEIGIGASGSTGSIAARLGIALQPDGNIKLSAIASMGLVTLPIFNSHIAGNAAIIESKLKLDYKTQDLYNYITDFSRDVNEAIGWIDSTGIKLVPHTIGALYRHDLSQIDVSSNSNLFLKNKFNILRNNTNSYTAINDLNSDLIQHQKADGSVVDHSIVTTFNGSLYPSNYAHLADGIFLNTSRFSTIPQTAQSIQEFADFIDSASIFLYGTRIQNLYANGISRVSRSSTLVVDGYGQFIIPPTRAITYLLNNGSSSDPVDDIDTGDDIIEFKPDNSVLDNNLFDSQFALVKPGDIIRVNYGGVEVPYVIKEKKYIQGDGVKKFIIRINGKNLSYKTNASARIDKPLFNLDKFGALSIAAANNEFNTVPSLIIGSPRSAVALGLGFNPAMFDSKHYILYLALFQTGNPSDGYNILPGIDVTGNQGSTPGSYTLDSIIETTNNAFRKRGFNYRFIAFQYKGEFGIMLADSFNNAGFQILNGIVNSNGSFVENVTNVFFPNNVVGIFGTDGKIAPDPLGFGSSGSNDASPPYLGDYPTPDAALLPAKIFLPLKRNNYYVNGIERDKLSIDVGQALDGYGDGYWIGEIVDRVVFPGSRVKVTYRILQDLSTSKLKIGKTLVAQSDGYGALVDYGRYIIENLAFNNCPGISNTDIIVYDAIHANGLSPSASLDINTFVKIYFSADSVGFNIENSTDETPVTSSFKRHFEVLIDQNGDVFTHERARININGSNITVNGITIYGSSQLVPFNIIKVSPKLRGYKFFSGTTAVNKINFTINNYDADEGIYTGFLSMWDGTTSTRLGPVTSGRIGEITRFYDETFSDHIDFLFEFNNSSSFSNKNIDIQLFPTLQLDEELFPIATCQLNDVTANISFLRDIRDFGNVSEKQLTTSALNYLSATDRHLHSNGIIRGFDITNDAGNPVRDQIRISGGSALVNGNFVSLNNSTVSIPIIKEKNPSSSTEYQIQWALCINDKNEFQAIPLLNSGLSSENRILLVRNPITGTTYNIDAILFSDIINIRKDLCVLYLVTANVTGSGLSVSSTLTYKDIRKYINDQDNNTPAVVTQGNSQGNFKNIETAINWIKNNNDYQTFLAIKGDQVFASDPNIDNIVLNIYAQGANASIAFNNDLTINNVKVTDLSLDINQILLANNCTFTNNTISVIQSIAITNSDLIKSSLLSNTTLTSTNLKSVHSSITTVSNATFSQANSEQTIFDIGGTVTTTSSYYNNCTIDGYIINATDVTFENCTITITRGGTLDNVRFINTKLVAGADLVLVATKISGGSIDVTNHDIFIAATVIRDCDLTCTTMSLQQATIDNSHIFNTGLITCYGSIIKNGIIVSTAYKTFELVPSSADDFILENNIISWSPVSVGAGFMSNDLVNSGAGFLHTTVVNGDFANMKVIKNNITITQQDHCPFVSIQLTDYKSVVKNVDISDNTFTSTMGSDDVRAIIAIVSTLINRDVITNTPQYPLLSDVHIDRNVCNYNQMIIVTGARNRTTGIMQGAAPACINVSIDDNVCGTIGYFIADSYPYNGNNAGSPSNGHIRDKASKLRISGNNCKFISNLDEIGDYIAFRATRFPSNNVYEEVDSVIGEAEITNNVCNWIQVGAGGTSPYNFGSGVTITGNTVYPSDSAFLSNFTSYVLQNVTPGNVGILLRREGNFIGRSQSTISENNIIQKATYPTIEINVLSILYAPSQDLLVFTATPHGLTTFQVIELRGYGIYFELNNYWTVLVVSSTQFVLIGTANILSTLVHPNLSSGPQALIDSIGIINSSKLYFYDCALACFNNAKVINNTIVGVINDSTNGSLMYFWDECNNSIIGNVMERRNLFIKGYFNFDGLSLAAQTSQRKIVTLNMLDLGSGTSRFVSYGVSGGTLSNGIFMIHNLDNQTAF